VLCVMCFVLREYPMRTKYLTILLTMLSITALAGFGCKGLSQTEQASIKPITLTYWTVFDDVGQLQKFAAAYKKTRPYVTVNIRQIRYEEFDDLFTNALADDIGPDVVSMHVRWLGKYEARLDPMPASVNVSDVEITGSQFSEQIIVTPRTNPMPSIRGLESNFIGTVASDVVIRNQIYGLPLALDTLALYYNKKILDKAGIAEPPTSWTTFLDDVKKITRVNGVGDIIQSGVPMGTGNNIDNATDIFALLLLQNGVDVVKDGTVVFAGGIDRAASNHPTLEALRFYTDFARPTKEVYSWNEKQTDAFTAFTQGRAGFFFGFAYDFPRIKSRAPQLAIEVIPVPQLNDNAPVNVANYWVESVVKKTKHRDEAWDFIRFMTTPENIKIYTDATKQPSPLRAHVAAQQEDPELGPFVQGILTAKNWYTGRDIDKANIAIENLMLQYLLPYADGQNALKRDAQLIINAATIVQQTL